MLRQIFSVGALFDGAGRFYEGCDLHIDGGVVTRIVPHGESGRPDATPSPHPDAVERIDLPNGFALPGLINSHHHAYSALARGMQPVGSLADFPRVLQNLWWRLDRSLDAEAVRMSALVTAIACVKTGCTAVVDHHASPHHTKGSLALLKDAFDALGMTSVLCFETSDRNGETLSDEAIEENISFARDNKTNASSRGLFGLHASFTLERPTLEKIARELPDDLPIHVHVAEDTCDCAHALAEGFKGPVDRLEKLGVLRNRSLLGHGVHLCEDEIASAVAADCFVAHNPESNFNNAVGYGDPARWPLERVLLGTDGMTSDMLGAGRFAFLAHRLLGKDGVDRFALVKGALFDNPSAYLSRLFGRPVGRIVEGAPADFAIFDYAPPTPLCADNWLGHLLYGFSPSPTATWVYARGVPVVENGTVSVLDETAALEEAKRTARAVWRRYTESA